MEENNMNQNYGDNDSRTDSYQSVGNQPDDNIQNDGYQTSDSNPDNGYQNGYQPNDSYTNNGYQSNDGYTNNGYQSNDSYTNNGYQPNDNYANNGYQLNDNYTNNGYQLNDNYTNNGYQSNNNYSNSGYMNNTYSGYQNNYQPYGNMPPYMDNQLELEEPVKISEWVLALVLMMIPCVNIIMMFVWAFSSTEKKSKSNFFKAYLIFFGIGLALAVLIWFGVIFFAALALS